MKNLLIILLSLISVFGFTQTQLDATLSPTPTRINAAIKGSLTASGTNTYTNTTSNFTLSSGDAIDITFTNGNTGASTFNLNGAGAITIKKFSSGSLVDVVSGDISSGERKRLYHNGTFLVIEGGTGSGGGSGTVTSISTTSPLSGGTITTSGTLSIANAAADGTTKGAASFGASDFDATSGNITIDHTNTQKASGSQPGELSSADWTTFNNKQSAITFGTGVQSALGNNIGSAGAPVLFNGAGGTPSSMTGTNITGIASGLTAGNVTTNANLTGAITSSGNATSLGSFSSSNLSGALTDETGSGATVFAVSPTLTGSPLAPTQSATDNSTKIATTAYADAGLKVANTQTASYTFALTDVGKIVRMNLTGTANNLTIPPNSSVAFPTGTWLWYEQVNTGVTTIVQGSGVTVTPPVGGSLVTPQQGILCAAYKTGTDTWELFNSITISGSNLSGTSTNDNATAGNVGERVTSLIASGSAVSLTTATAANITSISLSAGDWNVVGNVNFTETTSTVTARSAGINTTSATVPTDGTEAYCGVQSTATSEVNTIMLPAKVIKLASTTTVYLVGKATFSAGTCAGFGYIMATRVR